MCGYNSTPTICTSVNYSNYTFDPSGHKEVHSHIEHVLIHRPLQSPPQVCLYALSLCMTYYCSSLLTAEDPDAPWIRSSTSLSLMPNGIKIAIYLTLPGNTNTVPIYVIFPTRLRTPVSNFAFRFE